MTEKKSRGWVKLDRSIQWHWVYKDKPFNYSAAWLDLIMMAYFIEGKSRHAEILQEGELIVTQHDLADRWGWGRQKVRRFLRRLTVDSMVIQYATNRATKITICNYSKFQQNGTKRVTIKQPASNQQTTNKQPALYNKNEKNEEECIIIGSINFKLSFVEDKKKLFPMLDVLGEIRKCINWHTSKGRKMKDWNRAVANWLSIAFDRSATTGESHGSEYDSYFKGYKQKL